MKVDLPKFLIRIAGIRGPFILIIDRTIWRFGITDINFLVISIKSGDLSIPLVWSVLPWMGNCSYAHRIDLLEWLISCIGKHQIKYILGDREFVGKEWFKWLIANDISFYMRVKGGSRGVYKNQKVKIRSLFTGRLNHFKFIKEAVRVGDNNLWLSGGRIKTDKGKIEYLIIASIR